MTDFSPSDTDELVSAYLDNQVTDAQRATVEASPELMARAAAMRAVSQAVAQPVTPPSAETRQAHIAAALAAATYTAESKTAAQESSANVVSLGERREKKARSWGPRVAMGAAAAVVVALALIVGLGDNTNDGGSEVASSMPAVEAAADPAGDDGGALAGATINDSESAMDTEADLAEEPSNADAAEGEAQSDDGAMEEAGSDGDDAMSDDGGDDGSVAATSEAPSATPSPSPTLGQQPEAAFAQRARLPLEPPTNNLADVTTVLGQTNTADGQLDNDAGAVQCANQAEQERTFGQAWATVYVTVFAGEDVEIFVAEEVPGEPTPFIIFSLEDACAVVAQSTIP